MKEPMEKGKGWKPILLKIETNLTKKWLLFFYIGIFLLAGLFFVYAYNSNPADPAVFGHSLNEIDGVECSQGEAITRIGGEWRCVSISGNGGGAGSGIQNIVFLNPPILVQPNLFARFGTWHTYETSDESTIPQGAKAVILDRANNKYEIRIRKDNDSPSYYTLGENGIYPIAESNGKRSFQYSLDNLIQPGSHFRILGYIK